MSRHGFAVSVHFGAIGPYRIVRELGRGGMGHVYEAVHGVLEKRVAVKVLRSHLLDDAVSVQRFLREGRAACHVEHPNVVDVHELGTDDGVPYLVMELLEGDHLGARLRESRPLRLEELVEILLPVLSAVSAAHAAGIVHRDLKPSNIMLATSRSGNAVRIPKVLDFGTSKLRVDGAEQLLTITGAVLGTLHYMSPEQTLAPQNADPKSDQYSLGVILYECATGRKPFVGDSGYELMHAIMTAPITPPSALNPDLPAGFDDIVLRALNRAPRRRYPSVREFGAALLPFASEAVARIHREEFTAGAADMTRAVSVNAGWETGADGELEPSVSNRTWVDPLSVGTRPGWARWGGAAALAGSAILFGVVTASMSSHRAVDGKAAAVTAQRTVAAPPPAAPSRGFVSPPAAPPATGPLPVSSSGPSSGNSAYGVPVQPLAPRATPSRSREPAANTAAPGGAVLLGENGAPILE